MAEAAPAGSGGAPVPAAAVDGMLRIRGGVGGLSFQFAMSSMVFPGVGRDADHVAGRIAQRVRTLPHVEAAAA